MSFGTETPAPTYDDMEYEQFWRRNKDLRNRVGAIPFVSLPMFPPPFMGCVYCHQPFNGNATFMAHLQDEHDVSKEVSFAWFKQAVEGGR